MDRLEMIRIFLRVAELLSFTRASEDLGLPKASVSGAVMQLENTVGSRLLQRTTRRVRLTPDGEVFYHRGKQLLVDVDELTGLFRGPTELTGRLRVDMPASMAKNVVIPHLPEFLATCPGISVELSAADQRVDLIKEGFDCVIRVGTLTPSNLIARPLGHYRMVNCASPAYVRSYGEPRSLDDLPGHRLVHYVQTLGARPEGLEYKDGDGYRSVRMTAAVTVNSTEAYLAACLAGLGIIQVPEAGVRTHVEKGRLLEVLADYVAAPMPVCLLYPDRRNLAARVRAFMDWVSALMENYLSER